MISHILDVSVGVNPARNTFCGAGLLSIDHWIAWEEKSPLAFEDYLEHFERYNQTVCEKCQDILALRTLNNTL